MQKCFNLEYDVVLSFAGEDRNYVERTASFLRKAGVKVFYDVYEDVNLWGKDLYQHLDDVYQNKAKYAVIFISESYGKKLWTNHELKSAQARAFTENQEYILPARFDDTKIPGIRNTTAYINLKDLTPSKFAKKIIKKLGDIEPQNFLPDNIDFVRQVVKEIYADVDDDIIDVHVLYVFDRLKKLTDKERDLISVIAIHSCRHDITKDFHQDIALLERFTNYTREEIIQILKGISSLGFEYKITKEIHGTKEDGNEQEIESLHLKIISLQPELEFGNLTIFMTLMCMGAIDGKCESCSVKTLKRLDFSDLKDKISDEDLTHILTYFVPDVDDETDTTE